jgi:hypothetical protein
VSSYALNNPRSRVALALDMAEQIQKYSQNRAQYIQLSADTLAFWNNDRDFKKIVKTVAPQFHDRLHDQLVEHTQHPLNAPGFQRF